MDKPCFLPLLPPGFHDFDDDKIKSLCVEAFPNSVRRSMLYCNYIQLIEQFRAINQQCRCFSEVWIDGSFTTQKPEPDDVDILVVVDFLALNNLPDALKPTVSTLLNRDYVKLNYKIDVLLLAENHPDFDYDERRSYWRGWFGFDRKENPKGLARVML
ncbi:hypothetical protein DUC38_22435 [Salmonella enterica subsp. enterica serovar Saintpaul]|nr:hypothetical protein [Salmonella enterica subsp. enterica]EAW9675906.1 hypothetical protein [Salmonella enterica]ECT1255305.1 hypothetical protein [Salmonella enterica subsp. enterica serovar Saintpaul]EDW0631975.1 hypothetical protein [Salmonella enterica subsp. enterica serovar Anatum]EAY5854200.1 hypothetical protein [Salmonella enterica]